MQRRKCTRGVTAYLISDVSFRIHCDNYLCCRINKRCCGCCVKYRIGSVSAEIKRVDGSSVAARAYRCFEDHMEQDDVRQSLST